MLAYVRLTEAGNECGNECLKLRSKKLLYECLMTGVEVVVDNVKQ